MGQLGLLSYPPPAPRGGDTCASGPCPPSLSPAPRLRLGHESEVCFLSPSSGNMTNCRNPSSLDGWQNGFFPTEHHFPVGKGKWKLQCKILNNL